MKLVTAITFIAVVGSVSSCAEHIPVQHPYPLCERPKALPRTPDPRTDYRVLAKR